MTHQGYEREGDDGVDEMLVLCDEILELGEAPGEPGRVLLARYRVLLPRAAAVGNDGVIYGTPRPFSI